MNSAKQQYKENSIKKRKEEEADIPDEFSIESDNNTCICAKNANF